MSAGGATTPTAAGEPLLAATDLSFAYGGTVAVEAATFSVRAGEMVSLVGRNGSGKSTLLRGLLGLIAPTAGTLGRAVPLSETAYLPQQRGGDADFPASVWEVALSGRQGRNGFSPAYSGRDRAAAEAALEAMDAADLKTRRIGALSGGQRQRVLLARALCREARLLLLDEPYSGLDTAAAEGLGAILENLRRERGTTILMATHDAATVAAGGGRVIAMDRGIAFDGPAGAWARWRERSGKGTPA